MATHAAAGLRTLAFPCNQFLNQEAAANGEILNTLKYVRPGNGFVPSFDLTQKMAVNGAAADPIWVALRAACPAPQVFEMDITPVWLPISSTDVAWNFETFLLNKNGSVFRRYADAVNPSAIEPDILQLLAQ